MKLKEFILIIILVLPAALSLFHFGFFGASDDMHIAWLQQMDKVLQEGQIPPRYVPDLSFGFGYPLFNFIFPLPYYLGELIHIAGFSFVNSIKGVFVISLVASAVAMFVLVKHLTNSWVAMAAMTLYIYSPYRSTDIYVRGALGESLAFVFLPLIIYFILKLGGEVKVKIWWKWALLGGLAVGGLVLCHNIVAYMFMPVAFVFGLVMVRKWIKLTVMFGYGLLVSIYFWLPALVDSGLMKYQTVFNYFDHFPTLKQLIVPYFGYGASVPGPYDGMSFFVGEVNLIVMVLAVLLLVMKKTARLTKLNLFSLLTMAMCVFMMNFRSSWLWDHLPLIPYFQFPWRFLTMIVFFSSLLVVNIGEIRYWKAISVMVIILSIGLNYSRFRPHDFLLRDDSYYINRYIPIPTPSSEYLGLEEEYLRLPKIGGSRPKDVYPRVFPETNIGQLTIKNSMDAEFEVDSKNGIELNYNKYYFPGWRATIDGSELNLRASEILGQIVFDVPAGVHKISIFYKETIRNRILDVLSLASIMAGLMLVLLKSNRKIER